MVMGSVNLCRVQTKLKISGNRSNAFSKSNIILDGWGKIIAAATPSRQWWVCCLSTH